MDVLTGEVININNEYKTYREYKAEMDTELQKSAESFVRIGYLLKVAKDTDVLKESGYGDVYAFAQAEYNLDKSQVSRFIRINDEYSENGYSDRLQDKYKGFGYAKLALMLTLPDVINEELTAGFSVSEMRSIRDELEAEEKISDLEVWMEGKNYNQAEMDIFTKVLHQLGHDDPELYLKLWDAVGNTIYDGTNKPVVDKLLNALAPAGEAVISVRIQGEGRKLLSIKGAEFHPTVIDIRTQEKESCSWDELIEAVESLCEENNAKKGWETVYGESFPLKEEPKKAAVAPVQPKKEKKKVSKVTKAKVEKQETERKVTAEELPGSSHEEQLPGQMQLEKDFPEYCPEEKVVAVSEQPEMPSVGVNTSSETIFNRLTFEKPKEKMGMWELAHNSCYSKEGEARYRDFCEDRDARQYARDILKNITGHMVSEDVDTFDEEMLDLLQYDPLSEYKDDAILGLIALYYRNIWAQADLYERLKEYENTGHAPDEIRAFDQMYLEKCKEVTGLQEKVRELQAAAGVEEDDGK